MYFFFFFLFKGEIRVTVSDAGKIENKRKNVDMFIIGENDLGAGDRGLASQSTLAVWLSCGFELSMRSENGRAIEEWWPVRAVFSAGVPILRKVAI